jgi:hypothetical protein
MAIGKYMEEKHGRKLLARRMVRKSWARGQDGEVEASRFFTSDATESLRPIPKGGG